MFEAISGMLSELDVLSSFADLATSCPVPYVRPEVTASVRSNCISPLSDFFQTVCKDFTYYRIEVILY